MLKNKIYEKTIDDNLDFSISIFNWANEFRNCDLQNKFEQGFDT